MGVFKGSVKDGWNYYYTRNKNVAEGQLARGETDIVLMPKISVNKRGVNDIGWQCDGTGVTLYGTLSEDPFSKDAMWQEIPSYCDINKVVKALKLVNLGEACNVCIRVIMN